MTGTTIKSRPVYSSLKIDLSGRRHLLLIASLKVPDGALASWCRDVRLR